VTLKTIAILMLAALIAPAYAYSPQVRSQAAKHAFQRSHPCPLNHHKAGACNGYVIDHVVPLACGGADKPENMQWQTLAAGKAKDKWERIGCKGGKRVEK
jgi:hypothetical protein